MKEATDHQKNGMALHLHLYMMLTATFFAESHKLFSIQLYRNTKYLQINEKGCLVCIMRSTYTNYLVHAPTLNILGTSLVLHS